MKIKVRNGAAHGAVKPCLLTSSALGDPARKDAVEAKVKVR